MATSNITAGIVKWQERQVREVHSRMRKVVSHLVRRLKIELNVMKKGPRGGKLPSAPGEYPHKISGELQRQTQGSVFRQGDNEVDGYVFSTAEYAVYLEGEDEGGVRPFLSKILKDEMDKIRGFLFKKT